MIFLRFDNLENKVIKLPDKYGPYETIMTQRYVTIMTHKV